MPRRVPRITVTKAERAALERALATFSWGEDRDSVACANGLRTLLAKVESAEAPTPAEVAARPTLSLQEMERIALAALGPVYAPWVAGNPAALVSRARNQGVTLENLAKVVSWLATQRWVRRFFPGGVSLATIFKKWEEWLPQAARSAPLSPAAPTHAWSDD